MCLDLEKQKGKARERLVERSLGAQIRSLREELLLGDEERMFAWLERFSRTLACPLEEKSILSFKNVTVDGDFEKKPSKRDFPFYSALRPCTCHGIHSTTLRG